MGYGSEYDHWLDHRSPEETKEKPKPPEKEWEPDTEKTEEVETDDLK